MDRGPAGVDDAAGVDGAGSRGPGVRRSRRLLAAGLAAVVVLLVVIAVLATRLAGSPPAAKAATPSPAPTATPSTLAMVGFEIRCRASATSPNRRMRASPERVTSVAGPWGSDRSAPEQNAPPAPV